MTEENETIQEPSDFQILGAVVKYCLLVSTIPVVSFFVVKFVIFDGLFGLESVTSNVYSAIVAIVVLHVALGYYIYKANYEAEKVKKPIKAD